MTLPRLKPRDSRFNHHGLPMRGLTRCPRAHRFGRVPPYRMRRLRQQAQTFLQDVLCGVAVSVVYRAADRAGPLPDSQVLCVGPLCAADRAELGGREETVYCDHLFPVLCGLVLQLPLELPPARVRNRSGQFMVLDHVLWGQVLNTYDVVLPQDLGGQLVQGIVALVGDTLMRPGHFDPCLLPAPAPLCFSGELPLEAGQFLL